jgi:cell division initiation protein
MITEQDIREKCFEKARVGGYNMDEVDTFLDELADSAAASQKEIATLNAKMKYLADKIREYQSTEEAMNQALISAQKLAKSIQDDAQSKADALVASAQKEADDIVASAKAESDRICGGIEQTRKAEELRCQKAQAAAAEYIQKVRMLLDREQSFLTTLAEADLTGAIVTPAPAEKKAIAAPAEEPAEEAEEEPAAEEAPVEEAPAEADEQMDYFKAFEDAVYQNDKTADADSDAPEIKF